MRRLVAGLSLVLAVAAALPFVAVPSAPTRANGDSTFLIPASDGYGIADCLSGGHECGRVVADAWCEANGFGKATAYGQAKPEDITASVPGAGRQGAISISCID